MRGCYVITMIANILIECLFIVSIAQLAVHFSNPHLLWWYLLLPLMGYSIKSKSEDKNKEEKE